MVGAAPKTGVTIDIFASGKPCQELVGRVRGRAKRDHVHLSPEARSQKFQIKSMMEGFSTEQIKR